METTTSVVFWMAGDKYDLAECTTTIDGDGTVTYYSATIGGSIDDNRKYSFDETHKGMVDGSNSNTINKIIELLD